LIRAVVFDFDGTLFKFVLDYKGMREAVKEVVIAGGVPSSLLDEGDRIRDFVNKMLDFGKVSGWSNTKTSSTMNEINSIMDRYEWESAQKNTPVDGALEVLRNLRRMKLKTGLLTNNSRRSIMYLLEKNGFSRMFDVVVTRNDLGDFSNLKPSPIGLNLILAKFGVKANETIYVGDSVIDIKTALSVGATPIFVTTGFSTQKEVEENYPNVLIINMLKEILTYIEDLSKTKS
jgi:phosphoglycolate phosphatase